MKTIVLIVLLNFVVGCTSLPKHVDREVRAHKLSASQIIEIVEVHFAQKHKPLKPIATNTLIGELVSTNRKTRNTKVTVRLDAKDGLLLVRYSDIVMPETYISRKNIDRMLGRYNHGIEYALAAGSEKYK